MGGYKYIFLLFIQNLDAILPIKTSRFILTKNTNLDSPTNKSVITRNIKQFPSPLKQKLKIKMKQNRKMQK
jgi:hypothetical protein